MIQSVHSVQLPVLIRCLCHSICILEYFVSDIQLKLVKADIDAFVGGNDQFDDITMLCLEYTKKMENQRLLNNC